MRLSEREQRVLADLEHALTQHDPRFAAQFTAAPAPQRMRRLRRILRLLGRRHP